MNTRPGVVFSPDELGVLCRLLGVAPLAFSSELTLARAGAALSALAARGHLLHDDRGRLCVVGAVAATVRLAAEAETYEAAGGETVAVGSRGAVRIRPGRFGTLRLEPEPVGEDARLRSETAV